MRVMGSRGTEVWSPVCGLGRHTGRSWRGLRCGGRQAGVRSLGAERGGVGGREPESAEVGQSGTAVLKLQARDR